MTRPNTLRTVGILLVLLGVVLAGLALAGRRTADEVPAIVLPTTTPTEEVTRAPQPPIDRSRVHVDAATGDDGSGDGSETAPLATIQAAVDLADDRSRAGLPTTVVVAPGIYREEVELRPAPDATTSGPIIIEGRNAVVSGADPVTATGGADDLWDLPWTEDWGLSDLPDGWDGTIADNHFAAEPLLRRRELVVAGGRLLAPRNTLDEVEAEEGTFVVLEDEDRIVAHVASAITADGFEVGAREILLKIDGRRGIEVRGLTFQHAATRIQRKAVVVLASVDVLLEDLVVTQNSWFGVGFTDVRGAVVRRVIADENGVGGLTAFAVDDLLVEDSTTSRNGWRAGLSLPSTRGDAVIDLDLLDFASGQKFFRLRGATFRRHEAIGNVSNGLWFDFDNIDVVVEDAVIRDNGTQGIFVEANQGPVTIRSSRICGNEVGVLVTNSRKTSIISSTLGDNLIAQLFVAGQPERGITTREGEDLTLTTDALTLRGNVFSSSSDQHAVATRLSDAAWRAVLVTLSSDRNTFLAEPGAGGLQLPEGDRVGLSAWQDGTDQDPNSTAGPLASGCPDTPDAAAATG